MSRRNQIGMMLGDVLRELVDDVGFAGGVEGKWAEAFADERFPVTHDAAPPRE